MSLSRAQFTALAVMAAAIAPALANEKQFDARARSGANTETLWNARPQQSDDARGSGASYTAAAVSPSGQAALAVPSACGGLRTTNNYAGTNGPIGNAVPAYTPATFTTLVSGVGTYLWDVNLNTAITHSECADIEMFLTSPAGTIVTITTDNGGTSDNLFNGTSWDDNVNDPVTDKVFTNNVAATPLSPEGRLQNFRGENPNGTWTLTIVDDLATDVGNLASWSLDVSTLAGPPALTTTAFPKVSGMAIGPNALTTNDTVLVSGMGTYLMETELITTITHTWSADMDITLTSPGGPIVKVSTDNGGSNDHVFNGTLFDVDAPTPVTDRVYANNVTATPLSPEGSFDNWLGQDPNGTWTLTITDQATGDGGTLADWTVTATTIPTPTPSVPVNFAGTTGPLPDFVAGIAPGTTLFTATVAGAGAWLWDVDLTTDILHSFNQDLDISLISPAGTEVVITTDNGGTNTNVFNGTLWDDNANDAVTDHIYANNTAATPLSPEGRLAAFRGENPNGVWTLKVIDDSAPDSFAASMTSWSLGLATLSGPISETSHAPVSQSPNLAISATAMPLVTDTMVVAGLGTEITNLTLYLEVTHSFVSDLDITLTSPGGTIVAVTTNNGGSNDNCYNGSLFDPDILVPVTDTLYVNNVVETPISPEGSFDNFVGQNPNGNWTLSIQDDFNLDGGVFRRWDLTFRTCGNPPPVPYCFGDGSGTSCPCLPVPLVGDPDKGCPNGPFPGGGKLTATGLASISNDSLLMSLTTINNGGAVVFQGTNDNGGGLGTAFGDGLRCAAGAVRRMKSHAVTTNSHQYPDPAFLDNPISQRGAVLVPGDRWYQGWYRSGLAHCDPTQNYNATNAVKITWVP